MELQIINPLNFQGWDDLVLSFNDYTFFHSSTWAKVLYDTYHFKLLYFKVVEEDKLIALVPCMEVGGIVTGSKCISLPFSDYCGSLTTEKISMDDILGIISEERKKFKWKYIELKGGKGFDENISFSKYYYHHTLDISQNE